jgi:hypothetical protein
VWVRVGAAGAHTELFGYRFSGNPSAGGQADRVPCQPWPLGGRISQILSLIASLTHVGGMPLRFVEQRVVRSTTVTVQKELDLHQVVLEDPALRSPNGSKPMRRTYGYVATPEAAAAFGEAYAEQIHNRNVESQEQCLEKFSAAEGLQKQIEQRRRDKKRRLENKEKYGTARRPSTASDRSRLAIKTAKTPRTGQADRNNWAASTDENEGQVERELGYEED